MKNHPFILFALIILFSFSACQNRQPKNYNKSDVNQDAVVFIKAGIESGLTEIKASGLAITNSNNQRVIALAKMMIDDHTKTNEQLKAIESSKNVNETDTVNSTHQHLIDELGKMADRSFDKAYIQMMVKDHLEAVQLFTTGSQNSDTSIRRVASSSLPVLRMHLDSSKAILSALK